jgi:hypothetical protein
MFLAATKSPRGRITERKFDSAELAAQHLLMLAEFHGWTGDKGEAVQSLAAGAPLEYKGFEYHVKPVSGP